MFPTVDQGKQIKVASSCKADHQKFILCSEINVRGVSAVPASKTDSFGICLPNSRCLWRKSSWMTPLRLEVIFKMLPFVGKAFATWDRDKGRPFQTLNILILPSYGGKKQAAVFKHVTQAFLL